MDSLHVLFARLLSALTIQERASLVAQYTDDGEWAHYLQNGVVTDAGYVRYPIFRSANGTSVVLIHWPPGVESPIHDHAVHGCVMRVLRGALHERRIRIDGTEERKTMPFGDVSTITNEEAVHSISNSPRGPDAYSLHIYSDAPNARL